MRAVAGTFRFDGHEVAYTIRGRGPTCLVHPGGPGLAGDYLRTPALEEHVTAITLDPLGTGRSGGQGPYGRALDVRVLEALRAALGLDRVLVLGHSYGGLVAQDYALAHPEHVAGLVLYATSPTTGPEWEAQAAANLAWYAGESWYADAVAALDERGRAATQAELDASARRAWPLYFRAGAPIEPAWLDALRLAYEVFVHRVRTPFDVTSALAGLATPALVVTGVHDFIHGVTPAGWLVAALARPTVALVDDAAHFAHLEQPRAFGDALANFVSGVRGASPLADR